MCYFGWRFPPDIVHYEVCVGALVRRSNMPVPPFTSFPTSVPKPTGLNNWSVGGMTPQVGFSAGYTYGPFNVPGQKCP
jgi:hypothetical protein